MGSWFSSNTYSPPNLYAYKNARQTLRRRGYSGKTHSRIATRRRPKFIKIVAPSNPTEFELLTGYSRFGTSGPTVSATPSKRVRTNRNMPFIRPNGTRLPNVLGQMNDVIYGFEEHGDGSNSESTQYIPLRF